MSIVNLPLQFNPVGVVLTCPSLPSSFQGYATRFASYCASYFLGIKKQECTFKQHPMQRLYQLCNGGNQDQIKVALAEIPSVLRNDILNQSRVSNGKLLGLKQAIQVVAERCLEQLPESKKNVVFGTIYRLAGQPKTNDFHWGAHHAKDDTTRLIRALHRHQCLHLRGKAISVWSNLEKNIQHPSQMFHLYRKELKCGQINFTNGMGCHISGADPNARLISDSSAQGYNIHGTFSATVSPLWDLLSAVLGQGGTCTPPIIQLLEQWQDFFEKDGSSKILQLCTSRGAIEVNNALKELPNELRKRVIVITIAPACLISTDDCHRAVNLVIESDPVVQMAANRHLLHDPRHTWKLANHANNEHPHNLHGSSFREKLITLIDQYIRTNDIFEVR